LKLNHDFQKRTGAIDMSIDISIEKTQNTGFYYFGKLIPATTVWVRLDNLPSGTRNVVANIGAFEGTVNKIRGTSVIVPVTVPNGSYHVTCNYDLDGYQTCQTSIPITLNDNDPSIISWCNQQNNPQSSTSTSKTTSYGAGSSVQKSKSSSSHILLWMGFVSIGGFIMYKLLFHVKGDKK